MDNAGWNSVAREQRQGSSWNDSGEGMFSWCSQSYHKSMPLYVINPFLLTVFCRYSLVKMGFVTWKEMNYLVLCMYLVRRGRDLITTRKPEPWMLWYISSSLFPSNIYIQFNSPWLIYMLFDSSRCVSRQSSRMLLTFWTWIVITTSTTARHFEKQCASWWTRFLEKEYATCSFHKDLMGLIGMIDTRIAMSYSSM